MCGEDLPTNRADRRPTTANEVIPVRIRTKNTPQVHVTSDRWKGLGAECVYFAKDCGRENKSVENELVQKCTPGYVGRPLHPEHRSLRRLHLKGGDQMSSFIGR